MKRRGANWEQEHGSEYMQKYKYTKITLCNEWVYVNEVRVTKMGPVLKWLSKSGDKFLIDYILINENLTGEYIRDKNFYKKTYIIWMDSSLSLELDWESEACNKDLPDREGVMIGDIVLCELSRSSGVASESENKLSLW